MPDRLLIAILAAGGSRRLGQPKQLVNVNGEPLLRRQCRVAIESAIAPVAVILGCHADACAAALADLPVTIQVNTGWEEGLASSLREAVRTATQRNAAGVLVLHADQYRVDAHDLRTLHDAWERLAAQTTACRAAHADYTGPPVILPRACFPALLQLRGDEGARRVLSSLATITVIDVPMPNAIQDLDLPEHLDALRDACAAETTPAHAPREAPPPIRVN